MGSKQEGIKRFKERFGGEFNEGFLWKKQLTYKYQLYKIIKKIQFNKTKDIIDQEYSA